MAGAFDTGKGARILVAEDQSRNAALVERMLRRRGHSVALATTGAEALAMLRQESYDLVLMDCQMPVVDGLEATRELRRREQAEDQAPTPVVAMTVHTSEMDRETCEAAGMDDYLPKPITMRELKAVLARWLPAHRPDAEPPIDATQVDELRRLFPERGSDDVLAELERDVVAQLERIDNALQQGEGTEVASAAHRVLNSARLVGADAMADAAEDLEACAGDPEAVGRQRAVLEARWRAVRDALRL